MGEHCEYRVSTHDDPFQYSQQQQIHEGIGFFSLFGIILIAFAAVVGLVGIFLFHSHGDRGQPTVTISRRDSSCYDDDIPLNKNLRANAGENGECPGFSAVELL